GWREKIDFPTWGLRGVKAKIDTGARTSALHVESYRLVEDSEQGPLVELQLHFTRRRKPVRVTLATPLLRWIRVKNSSGLTEERPLVATTISLGPVTKDVELTITNRQRMLFPMLLGRRAVAGDFLVDVSHSYLLE